MVKAYGRVELSYLEATMIKLGFHHNFVPFCFICGFAVTFWCYTMVKTKDFRPSRETKPCIIHRGPGTTTMPASIFLPMVALIIKFDFFEHFTLCRLWAWRHEQYENFRVRSAYMMLVNSHTQKNA